MRKVRSVSFDMSDPHEAALYARAGKAGKFSRYVKRLIAAEMDGKVPETPQELNLSYPSINKTEPIENGLDSFL